MNKLKRLWNRVWNPCWKNSLGYRCGHVVYKDGTKECGRNG